MILGLSRPQIRIIGEIFGVRNNSLVTFFEWQPFSYLHTKDQFKWFGSFEELICLVKILLETNDTGEFSENQTHKMLTFRVGDIIVKWYSTTHRLQTQGSCFASLRTKLMKVYSSKDELLALQVNNSSDSNVLKRFSHSWPPEC